jgi:hypothetical protein
VTKAFRFSRQLVEIVRRWRVTNRCLQLRQIFMSQRRFRRIERRQTISCPRRFQLEHFRVAKRL